MGSLLFEVIIDSKTSAEHRELIEKRVEELGRGFEYRWKETDKLCLVRDAKGENRRGYELLDTLIFKCESNLGIEPKEYFFKRSDLDNSLRKLVKVEKVDVKRYDDGERYYGDL